MSSVPSNVDVKDAEPILVAAVDIGRNALWNYVTLITWLRWLRRFRAVFSVLPVICGGLGSWRILTNSSVGEVPIVAAALAFSAGLLPLLYVATGIEDNISNATHLGGLYRSIEARVRDFVLRFRSLQASEREEVYAKIFSDYLEVKGVAHTVPRWAFRTAEKAIARRDYVAISADDAGSAIR